MRHRQLLFGVITGLVVICGAWQTDGALAERASLPVPLRVMLNLVLHLLPAIGASGRGSLLLLTPAFYLIPLAQGPLACMLELLIPALGAEMREERGLVRVAAGLRRMITGLETQWKLWRGGVGEEQTAAAEVDDVRAILSQLTGIGSTPEARP